MTLTPLPLFPNHSEVNKRKARGWSLRKITIFILLLTFGLPSVSLPAITGEKSAKDIFRDSGNSVVVIQSNFGSGTGFLIGNGDLVVTNYHVVAGADTPTTEVLISFRSGRTIRPTGVVAYDIMRDLCIFRVSKLDDSFRPLKFANDKAVEVGEKVYAIGNPLGQNFSISDGIISQVIEGDFMVNLQFTAPISSGNSGGPLLNTRGEVLGVVSQSVMPSSIAIVQNMNYAIGSSAVTFLSRNATEIDLEAFFAATSYNSPFLQTWQSLPQTTLEDQYNHLQNSFSHLCSDISGKNCFFLYMYLLIYSSQIMYNDIQIDKTTALEWSRVNRKLVEQAGGVESLSRSYKKFFNPSDEALKGAREYTFSAGDMMGAIGEDSQEARLKSFERYSSANKESLITQQLQRLNMLVTSDIDLDKLEQSPEGWLPLKGIVRKGSQFRTITSEDNRLCVSFEMDIDRPLLGRFASPVSQRKREARYRVDKDFILSGSADPKDVSVYAVFKPGSEFKATWYNQDDPKVRAYFFLFLSGDQVQKFKSMTSLK